LAREIGRTGDTQYPDPDVQGFNPCAEQSLAPFETCCLAEIHLPNIESKLELEEVARYLYKINKHSLALHCHSEETQAIVHKNMRMGIGITGYCMATEEQKSWLKDVYYNLRNFDSWYSKEKGFPPSIKLTTIKPSGTLSLLSGVTPGAHPGFSHYHIRRIRMASNSALVNVCRQKGYKVEFQRNFDGSDDTNTVVVEFPSKFPENTLVAKDVCALAQLELVKKLQAEWSDNSVSVTIYYRLEELSGIKAWLKANYNNNLKTVSFLLHSDHGFDQAPLEEITRQEYESMIKLVQPIDNCEINEEDIKGSFECATGMCPIK
jgi:ribonucleotide reductase alpha subunit